MFSFLSVADYKYVHCVLNEPRRDFVFCNYNVFIWQYLDNEWHT